MLKACIYKSDKELYITLNQKSGEPFINEKINQEAICAKTTPCALGYIFRLIQKIKVALLGAEFVIQYSVNFDVGVNGMLHYSLKPSDHFTSQLQSQMGVDKKNMLL